jgi:hypothetical protein
MTHKIYPKKELWDRYVEVTFSSSLEEFDAAKIKIVGSNKEMGEAFSLFNPEGDKLGVIFFLKTDNGIVVNQATHLSLQFFRYLSFNSAMKDLSPEEYHKHMLTLVPMLSEAFFNKIIEARNSSFGIPE